MIDFKTILTEWDSPNSYSNNFSHLIPKPGVYAIVLINLDAESDNYGNKEIVYIGSAINLKNRLASHEVVKVLRAMFDNFHITIHFKECQQYKKLEKKLIRKFMPKINKQYV